jgi:hypothetical protein
MSDGDCALFSFAKVNVEGSSPFARSNLDGVSARDDSEDWKPRIARLATLLVVPPVLPVGAPCAGFSQNAIQQISNSLHPKISNDVHIESGARNAVQRSGQRTTNQILDAQALQNAGHSQSHFDRLGSCHRELGRHAFRIPAERPYHCRPINGHRCESQLGFTSVDAGMSQPNSGEGQSATALS